MGTTLKIALIKGDGIGIDVSDATVEVVDAALARAGAQPLEYDEIRAGAGCFAESGQDIEPDGEARAGAADAIFLGAIGLPSVRHADGTEISPHLRLRDRFGLYAGVRPVKAYPNAPQRLADPRAGVRRAALLALVDLGELTTQDVLALRIDEDAGVAHVAGLWLSKVGGQRNPPLGMQPDRGDFVKDITVTLVSSIDKTAIRFT
uniref:isocitrate/isopropylmalate family dehydrogenase n=1 Tax=Marinovum algicola TaxID=42444 RepID=UPI0024BA3452